MHLRYLTELIRIHTHSDAVARLRNLRWSLLASANHHWDSAALYRQFPFGVRILEQTVFVTLQALLKCSPFLWSFARRSLGCALGRDLQCLNRVLPLSTPTKISCSVLRCWRSSTKWKHPCRRWVPSQLPLPSQCHILPRLRLISMAIVHRNRREEVALGMTLLGLIFSSMWVFWWRRLSYVF